MFSVPGRITLIGNQRIQIFQYETSSAAKSKAQTISPQGDKIGSGIVDWIGIPHFYRLGNLIVLYVGSNNDVTKALTEVLGNQFAGG